MGVDVGLDLVNQLPGVGCIYVDDKGKIFAQKI
jgi:thiamine biosynthesis lipoprotein